MTREVVRESAGEHQERPKRIISSEAIGIVNNLFRQLRASFPAWKNSFPDAETYKLAKQHWVDAFIENGICTREQLERGIKVVQAKGSPFWPSVGEFIAACKPSDKELGIPDLESAWQEAGKLSPLSSKWSSGLVYEAARLTNFYKIRHLCETKTRPIFKKHFERLAAEIRNGGDMPAKPIPRSRQIEHIEHKLPKEEQLSKIHELRRATGL
jgi:hypothetical protein